MKHSSRCHVVLVYTNTISRFPRSNEKKSMIHETCKLVFRTMSNISLTFLCGDKKNAGSGTATPLYWIHAEHPMHGLKKFWRDRTKKKMPGKLRETFITLTACVSMWLHRWVGVCAYHTCKGRFILFLCGTLLWAL